MGGLKTWVAFVAALCIVSMGAARADETFAPQAVFALPAHSDIDDRCQDARAFTTQAAKNVDAVEADTAIAAAQALILCFKLPRLNPDEVQQRFLFLAAATALYVAATRMPGERAAPWLDRADAMARELAAIEPDRSTVIVHHEAGRSLWNPAPANPGKESYTVDHDPRGVSHPGPYSEVALALVRAIAERRALVPQVAAR